MLSFSTWLMVPILADLPRGSNISYRRGSAAEQLASFDAAPMQRRTLRNTKIRSGAVEEHRRGQLQRSPPWSRRYEPPPRSGCGCASRRIAHTVRSRCNSPAPPSPPCRGNSLRASYHRLRRAAPRRRTHLNWLRRERDQPDRREALLETAVDALDTAWRASRTADQDARAQPRAGGRLPEAMARVPTVASG
jgi:hypothetical protein